MIEETNLLETTNTSSFFVNVSMDSKVSKVLEQFLLSEDRKEMTYVRGNSPVFEESSIAI